MTILIATGLVLEARAMRGSGRRIVTAGGDAGLLEARLEASIATGTIRAVLSSGLAGGLAPGLAPGSIVVDGDEPLVSRLLDACPGALRGIVLGGDRPVAAAEAKRLLFAETGAWAADMESHVAARVAQRRALPFAALRVIADDAEDTLPDAVLAGMASEGQARADRVLLGLLRRPGDLVPLVRIAARSLGALKILRKAHRGLTDLSLG